MTTTASTPRADRDAVDAADALVNGVPYYGTDLVAGMILDDGTGNQFIVMNLQPAYTLQVAGKVTTFTPDYTRTLVTLRDTQEAHWSAYDRVVTIDNQDQFTVIESPRAYTGE